MPCPDPDEIAPDELGSISSQATAAGQVTATASSQAQARHDAKAARQRANAHNSQVCSRCQSPKHTAALAALFAGGEGDQLPHEEEDDRPVLKMREERFCKACALRLISHRASRGPGGYSHARGACLLRMHLRHKEQQQEIQSSEDDGRILLALSGGPASRALLHLSTELFGAKLSSTSQPTQTSVSRDGDTESVARASAEMNSKDDDADSLISQPASTSTKKAASKRNGRIRGSQRPQDVQHIDVLHVDDRALFYTPSQESLLEAEREDRQQRLAAMVEHASSLVQREEERSGLDGAETKPRYRLVIVRLEDVFCSDEQLACLLRGGARSDGCSVVDCSVESEPSKTIQARSSLSASSRPSTQLLRDLFYRVASTASSSDSSSAPTNATPRTALTRVEDLQRVLLDVLLRRIALLPSSNSPGTMYQSLLLGTSATRLAVRLMDALSKGEGAKLAVTNSAAHWLELPAQLKPPSQLSSACAAHRKVLVLRPLAEVGVKEISWFVRNYRLETLTPRLLSTAPFVSPHASTSSNTPVQLGESNSRATLERLTEQFVLNLEKGVSSTVSTIGKTGSKLVLKDAAARDQTSQPPGVQIVGPSIMLSRTSSSTASGKFGNFRLKDLYEDMKIGAQQKLVYTVCDIPIFPAAPGTKICPFCAFPAQAEDASAWRSRISIHSLKERGVEAVRSHRGARPKGEEASVSLSAALCYACTLVLDLPSVSAENATAEDGSDLSSLRLPSYVHNYLQSSSAANLPIDENGSAEAEDTIRVEEGDLLNGFEPTLQNQPATSTTVRSMDRGEMRRQLDTFLLNEADA